MENIVNTPESQFSAFNGTASSIAFCGTTAAFGVTKFTNGTTLSFSTEVAADTSSVSMTWRYDPTVDPSLLEALSSDQGSLELNAAQDHANGISYFAVKVQRKHYLLTSGRQAIPFGDLPAYGIRLRSEEVSRSGFSSEGIRDYLLGRPVAEPMEVYKELLSYTGNYIFFKEPEAHVIAVLYAIGTYFHCLFPSVGYLHLRGEKGSGKTRCCSVLSPVVFNGEASVSLRPEVFCHSINTNRSTLLWDEAQYFGRTGINRNGNALSILKSGIYPDARIEMRHRGAIVDYSTFGPKILAGTNHLDPELEDRTIEIIMSKNLPHEHVARYVQSPALKRRQQQLCDLLYALALRYGPVVAEMRNMCAEEVERLGLEGRAFDIYYPMFLMAIFIDSYSGTGRMDITNSVLAFVGRAKELKRRREIIDNVIVQLLTLVKDYVAENHLTPNSINQIIIPTEVLFTIAKDREYIPSQRKKSWLTRQLDYIDITNYPAKIGGKSKRVYEVDMQNFEDRCRRSLPPDEKSVTANCNPPEA